VHGGGVQAVRTAQGVARRDGTAGQRDRSVAAGAGEGADLQHAGPRRGSKLLVPDNRLVAIRATGIRVSKDTHPAESRADLKPLPPTGGATRQDPWPGGHESSRVMQKR
jgi:hypothetical protein